MNLKIKQIQEFKNKEYLFHGSSNGEITSLEARDASDVDLENTFNNDKAVFATNNYASSVIFSLIDRNKMPADIKYGTWEIQWDEDGSNCIAKIPISWKNYLARINGFLYVLPSESFRENNGAQFKSKENVIPNKVIEVNLEDYFSLGGKLEWISTGSNFGQQPA